jgi:hypothetical protein
MARKKIKLKEGNRATHKLKMDGREIVVYHDVDAESRTVVWDIRNNHPGHDQRFVKSFRIVGPSPHPFTTDPGGNFGTSLELVVREDAPQQVWKYTIEWKDRDDQAHPDDPKISVMPSPFFPKDILASVVVIGTALLGVGLWSRKNKKWPFN